MNAAPRHDAAESSNPRELLSSLSDGECDAASADEACRRWRSDEHLRADWHLYQLIGDVLRSDELAGPASRDADFVRALRTRLAGEPVPLAPRPLRPGRWSRRWLASAAVAASFVAVGATVVMLEPADRASPTGWNAQMAGVQPAEGNVMRLVGAPAPAASAHAPVVGLQGIRDARLDAYFEAHRGAAGPMLSALPWGAPRPVEILVPHR